MSARTDTVPTAPAAKPRLKRSIGLWMATALVIGNMVGSGIFTLPAALSGEAGPASIVALVFTGIGAMLLALVFAISAAPIRRRAGRTTMHAGRSATSSASRPRGRTGSPRGSGTPRSQSRSPATSACSGTT
jgi:amino acid transporter